MPVLQAHAKVNLFLHVLARESTGYHQIETLFCRIALADEILIEPGPPGIRLDIDGDIPGDPRENLVRRAAELFFRRIDRTPAVRIGLTKRIPIGAGLGGGSSDAAATLHGLNELHGPALEPAELTDMGALLGSDVAFFVSGADLALAWGRGERMIELPALPPAPLLLAVPRQPMPTAEAYDLLARSRAGTVRTPARVLHANALSGWETVSSLAHNDFQGVVFQRLQELTALHDTIRDGGARIALLAGSGSALFGVFDDAGQCTDAARLLRDRFSDTRVIRTVTTRPGRR